MQSKSHETGWASEVLFCSGSILYCIKWRIESVNKTDKSRKKTISFTFTHCMDNENIIKCLFFCQTIRYKIKTVEVRAIEREKEIAAPNSTAEKL